MKCFELNLKVSICLIFGKELQQKSDFKFISLGKFFKISRLRIGVLKIGENFMRFVTITFLRPLRLMGEINFSIMPVRFVFWLVLLGMMTAWGCKTTQSVVASDSDLRPRSAKFLMKQLVERQVRADWLSARLRIDYRDPYERTKFNVNLRMRTDSVIWMNIKKVSVEAARVLITPDSIYIINRLDNQYLIKPTDWLQQEFGSTFGFNGLQAGILGNPVFLTRDLDADVREHRYRLEGRTDRYFTQYLLDGLTYALHQIEVRDERERGTAVIRQLDYQPLGDEQPFSMLRELTLNGSQGEVELAVEWSKVEINEPKNIIFSIPPRYERVEQFTRP